MSHLNFGIFQQFCPIKLTCLVTLFDRKLQVFKNSPKLTIFGIFSQRVHSKRKSSSLRLQRWKTFSVIFKHREHRDFNTDR